MEEKLLRNFARDIQTQYMIILNKNYSEVLHSAYLSLKQSEIKNYEEFCSSNIHIGAFEYSELTFYDRMKDEKYASLVIESVSKIKTFSEVAMSNPNLGDCLANSPFAK